MGDGAGGVVKAHSRPAPLGVVAIVRVGGTITHHHGVGEDHVPWLGAEKGAQGMGLLRAIKREMDPAGVLNPGKLVG